MGETRIVGTKSLVYSGLLNVRELYAVINEYYDAKSYDKEEKQNREIVTEQGKDVYVELKRCKEVSDYYKISAGMKIMIRKLVDVEVEVDGRKKNLKKGEVTIKFKNSLESDWAGKWQGWPLYFFITLFAEKFFNRSNHNRFINEINDDVDGVYKRISGYLNLQNYKYN